MVRKMVIGERESIMLAIARDIYVAQLGRGIDKGFPAVVSEVKKGYEVLEATKEE